jgi:hypothetical protein
VFQFAAYQIGHNFRVLISLFVPDLEAFFENFYMS